MSDIKSGTYRRLIDSAQRQGGFIALRQARKLGCQRSQIESWLRTGRLIRAWHGVYAVGHLPSDPHARAYGAVLAAGDDAALAGASAAAFYGALRRWPSSVELLSPRLHRVAGLTIRQSSTLGSRDIWRFDGLRVTSPARTALDLAPTLSVQQCKRVVDHLRLDRRSRLTLSELADIVQRNPRHPGAAAVRRLIRQGGRARRSRLERVT